MILGVCTSTRSNFPSLATMYTSDPHKGEMAYSRKDACHLSKVFWKHMRKWDIPSSDISQGC